MNRELRLLLALVMLTVATLAGCARGGEDSGVIVPQAILDVWVRFAGPVDDAAHYFVAFDRDGDFGEDYPVPIAAGPFWGNGWGTGSLTHFLEYRLSSYNFYEANMITILRQAGGGITGADGQADGHDSGQYTLTVGQIAYGAASVSGAGMVTAVANSSGQNAGTIDLDTDAAGQVVAGSVAFTSGADGGRTLSAAEQAQINTLNAGGVALGANSLNAFGLTLTVGPAGAGSQTITIDPTTAVVQSKFVPVYAGVSFTRQTTLTANSTTPTATPPIPGATITTTDFQTGGEALINVEISQTPILIGPPYAFTPTAGGSTLRAEIDLTDFGTNLDNLSINIISSFDLIFDPNITDRDQHCYDGLGVLGNDAITIPTREFRSYSNSTSFVPEGANDTTLEGPVSQEQRNSVDIIDWWLAIKRLQ